MANISSLPTKRNQPPDTISPFLKWAGGKRWLTQRFAHAFEVSFSRYVEPFLGGGAVFFHLQPKSALLGDLNSDLINVYETIRDNLCVFKRLLTLHHNNHTKHYYYKIRATEYLDATQRAARLVYLNRTCWNGLYRVNQKGQFNVPIGTKNWVISERDDFDAISKCLQGIELRVSDFANTLSKCGEGDFVFVDPPYTTAHNTNGFVKYNEKIFSWSDQKRLRHALLKAKARGASFLVTNAAHESLIHLFSDVGRTRVIDRHSILSGSSTGRIRTQELLIYHYGELSR